MRLFNWGRGHRQQLLFTCFGSHFSLVLPAKKYYAALVVIVIVVCGKICGYGKICVKNCCKTETLLDWNTNWCGSRY